MKKIFKNPWFVSIASSLIASIIVAIVISISKKINILKGLFIVYTHIKDLVIMVLTYSIPVWIINIGIILYIIIRKILIAQEQKRQPAWLTYTKGGFYGWLFTWQYTAWTHTLAENTIKAICPNCECDLSKDQGIYKSEWQTYLYCPNCNKKFQAVPMKVFNDVAKLIVHNIKTSSYEQ